MCGESECINTEVISNDILFGSGTKHSIRQKHCTIKCSPGNSIADDSTTIGHADSGSSGRHRSGHDIDGIACQGRER